MTTKPGYWVCGGGSNINCDDWDDVNGCWRDQPDAHLCKKYNEIDMESDEA